LLAVEPNAIDAISPAFHHMKRQIFSPFRFGQWVRLAIVGFLAGEMGGGGGGVGNMNFPLNLPSDGSQQFQAPDIFGGNPLLFAIGVALLVVLVVVLWIVLLYVNSRMRFVLFDSIIAGECHVRQFWRQRGEPAFRYFIFQILFFLVVLFGLALLFAPPLLLAAALGWFENPREHILGFVLGGIVLVLLFLASMIAIALVHILTKDFVVPQMALDGASVSQGWSRLWSMMETERLGFAGYLGMKFVMAIAAAILVGIIAFIGLLILLIPIGGVSAVAVLGGGAIGLTWNPVTIAIAIVVGVIAILLVLFVVSLISVPAIVFFPAYSVHFFAARYAPLRMALYPENPINTPSPQP
jgi:hypothetical protein